MSVRILIDKVVDLSPVLEPQIELILTLVVLAKLSDILSKVALFGRKCEYKSLY